MSDRNPPAANGRGLQKLPPGAGPEARKAMILKLIETRGLRPRQAALAAGVPSSSFYVLVDGDGGFRSEIEMAEARFESLMVGSIVRDGISLRSWRAKLELLRARFPDRYGERLDLHVKDETEEDRLDEAYPGDALDDRFRALVSEAQERLSKEAR